VSTRAPELSSMAAMSEARDAWTIAGQVQAARASAVTVAKLWRKETDRRAPRTKKQRSRRERLMPWPFLGLGFCRLGECESEEAPC
jgi:hypothetical protein